jgi:hypothetical protein
MNLEPAEPVGQERVHRERAKPLRIVLERCPTRIAPGEQASSPFRRAPAARGEPSAPWVEPPEPGEACLPLPARGSSCLRTCPGPASVQRRRRPQCHQCSGDRLRRSWLPRLSRPGEIALSRHVYLHRYRSLSRRPGFRWMPSTRATSSSGSENPHGTACRRRRQAEPCSGLSSTPPTSRPCCRVRWMPLRLLAMLLPRERFGYSRS